MAHHARMIAPVTPCGFPMAAKKKVPKSGRTLVSNHSRCLEKPRTCCRLLGALTEDIRVRQWYGPNADQMLQQLLQFAAVRPIFADLAAQQGQLPAQYAILVGAAVHAVVHA